MTRPGDPPPPHFAVIPSWSPPVGPPRPWLGPVVGVAVGIAAAVAVLGVPFGLLWAMLAPDVPVRVTQEGLAFAQSQPEQPMAADGWFVVLGAPFGALAAVGVWAVRPARGTSGLVALTVGAVAAALIAWGLGRQVGLAGYQDAAARAEVGAALGHPPDLGVVEVSWWPPMLLGVPFVPALVAAVTYTLMAAWSRFPSLRPEHPPPDAFGHDDLHPRA